MRITDQMLSTNTLSDILAAQRRTFAAQQQVSDGKRLHRAADDPAAVDTALRLRSELAGNARQQANVSEAQSWLDATDTALGAIGDVVHRARELTLQGANDTQSATSREAIAKEIDQLILAAKDHANATLAGRYLFHGTDTTAQAYPAGSDVYDTTGAGSGAGTIAYDVGPNVSVGVNITADGILGSGPTANAGAGDGLLLDTLRGIAAHLRAGDTNALGTSDLKALDANLETVSDARSATGAAANRVEVALSRLQDVEQTTTSLLSDTEDVDMAKAIVTLSTQQTAYQAALRAGANVIQPSLLDFLR